MKIKKFVRKRYNFWNFPRSEKIFEIFHGVRKFLRKQGGNLKQRGKCIIASEGMDAHASESLLITVMLFAFSFSRCLVASGDRPLTLRRDIIEDCRLSRAHVGDDIPESKHMMLSYSQRTSFGFSLFSWRSYLQTKCTSTTKQNWLLRNKSRVYFALPQSRPCFYRMPCFPRRSLS